MGLIGIYTTNKCNLACKYCFANSEQKELDVQIISGFVEYYIKNTNDKNYNLVLTGGEPLLYKGLKELIINLRNKVNDITLLTNGILLTNEWIKFIKENRITLNISLDSINGTYHNKYRGEFETIYNNLEKLKNYSVEVCMTISHENISDVEKMISYTAEAGFMLDLNLISLDSDNPLAWVNANEQQRQRGIREIEKWVDYTNRIAKGKLMITFLKKRHVEMPVCYNKKHSLSIHTDGQVYPCFVNRGITYGNIYVDSFEKIMLQLNEKRTADCKECFCLDCLGIYD